MKSEMEDTVVPDAPAVGSDDDVVLTPKSEDSDEAAINSKKVAKDKVQIDIKLEDLFDDDDDDDEFSCAGAATKVVVGSSPPKEPM